MAITQNFIIDQGATFSTELTIVDSTNTAVDLATASFKGSMKTSYQTLASYDLTLTIKSPSTSGIVTVSLTNLETAAIPAGRYVYDILLTLNSVETRIVEGIITVTPQVTT